MTSGKCAACVRVRQPPGRVSIVCCFAFSVRLTPGAAQATWPACRRKNACLHCHRRSYRQVGEGFRRLTGHPGRTLCSEGHTESATDRYDIGLWTNGWGVDDHGNLCRRRASYGNHCQRELRIRSAAAQLQSVRRAVLQR
jgi:hypothetical protein